MSLVIKTKGEKKSPHLALTHNELQSGAANGRNVSLLMKADVEIDDETKEILKGLLGESSVEDIEKQSANGKRDLLDRAVKDKFGKEPHDWAWLEDFDENTVVFSNGDGVSYAEYSIDENDVVTLGESQSANRVVSYSDETGSVVLSTSDAIKKSAIPDSVSDLIAKSFDGISKNEKLLDVFKSKYDEGVKAMDELQKAHDLLKSQVAGLQADLEKANAEKDAALEALAAVEKAQQEAKDAQRMEALKEVVAEDKVEDLHKSLVALDDAAFETVLKSLKASKEVVEESDLFVQKSAQGEDGEKDSRLAFQDMLKSKYAKKQ